jgi:aarF domain-containing kinase
VKWGQWAATRQDIFPPYVCKSLARLQTNAASHSYEHSVKVIEHAFGVPIDTVFEKFEHEAIASGSVAQV